MTGTDSFQESIICEAGEPGKVFVPIKLLEALANDTDPITTLMEGNQSYVLFEALQQELGFVRRAELTQKPLNETEQKQLICFVRWLMTQMRDWPSSDKSRVQAFASIIVSAVFLNFGGALWRMLPDNIGQNIRLTEIMVEIVARTAIEYGTQGLGAAPIWEIEAVDAFQKADQNNDWVKVAQLWRPLENACRSNVVQTQAMKYLIRFAFDRLINVIDTISQTPAVMILAQALSRAEKIRLANACKSPRVRFCCVYQVVARSGACIPLTKDDIDKLSDLLSQISTDKVLWREWMYIFNEYPVRYPAFQESLGRALTTCSIQSIYEYVNSIKLYPWPATNVRENTGRQCVAQCLAAFSEAASPEQKRALWTAAHSRWLAWGFNGDKLDNQLMEISRSDLDYAVTAYALECMTEEERNDSIKAIRQRMANLENEWHRSMSDCITIWNRLLSQMQPYAHVESMNSENEDILTETRVYWPFDMKSEIYACMMYQI